MHGTDRRQDGGATLFEEIAAWLMDEALKQTSVSTLFAGCCERLEATGLPLWRAHLSYTTLHPLYAGQGVTWLRGQGNEMASFEHRDAEPERWLNSPLYHLIKRRIPNLRRRLAGPLARLDFPVLKEYREAGATDYLAYVEQFGPDTEHLQGMVGSWATDREDGFTEAEIASLKRLQKSLAVAAKMSVKDQVASNLASTYLGPTAGSKVLDGRIQRGDVETIHAVIWLSDMRGSTRLAEALEPIEYIAALNAHFEAIARPLLARGGEVLSFLGDGVLGIIPIGPGGVDEATACARAVDAGREALARAREDGTAFGLALHLGDVMFGNIGVPERLSFSVIGPAVNEAARLEGLTKALGRPMLVSDRVARNVDLPWDSMGERLLRGVGRGLAIYALPEKG